MNNLRLKLLVQLKQYGERNKIPNISEINGKFLHFLIQTSGAKNGLEIGSANGYSSIWIGDALEQNGGKLLSFEIAENAYNEALKNIKKAELDNTVEIVFGDFLENNINSLSLGGVAEESNKEFKISNLKFKNNLKVNNGKILNGNIENCLKIKNGKLKINKTDPSLCSGGCQINYQLPFDFIFIDGKKREYLNYLQAVIPFINKKTIIVIDDVIKFKEKCQNLYDFLDKSNDFEYFVLPIDNDNGIKDGVMIVKLR